MQAAWLRATPKQSRVPIDETVLRAMAALCLLWDWPLIATALLLFFTLTCGQGTMQTLEQVTLALVAPMRFLL